MVLAADSCSDTRPTVTGLWSDGGADAVLSTALCGPRGADTRRWDRLKMGKASGGEQRLSLHNAGVRALAEVCVPTAERPLASLKPVRSLSLHFNLITELQVSALAPLGNLRYLDLSSNSITEITGALADCVPQLEELNLASNRLLQLTGLRGLTRLRRLNASFNLLTSIEGVAELAEGDNSLEQLLVGDVGRLVCGACGARPT